MTETNCIFCKIVEKTIPSHTIYEDDDFLAFLDINPFSDGHTLLIPKDHHEYMEDVPDEKISTIFIRAKKLMEILKDSLGCEVVVLSVVGTDVPHFHIHLIPRFKGESVNSWPTKQYAEGEAEKIAKTIKSHIENT